MQSYVKYDYKEIKVKSDNVDMYIDSYNNFGWKLDTRYSIVTENNTSIIRLRRNQKIINKVELTRLERNFEDCIRKINFLEKSINSNGLILSIIIEVLVIVLTLGGIVVSFNRDIFKDFYILLIVPGIIALYLPYFLYKYIRKKREYIVNNLIDEKYKEIYKIHKKGKKLLKINNSQTFL